MRKITLAIETLTVESFETAESATLLRGTVAAHMPRPDTSNCPIVETYYAGNTCECTLAQSCIQTDCGLECWNLSADTICTF